MLVFELLLLSFATSQTLEEVLVVRAAGLMADVEASLLLLAITDVIRVCLHNLGVAFARVLVEHLARLVPVIVELLLDVLSEEALRRVSMVAAAASILFLGHGGNESLGLVEGLLHRLLPDQALQELLVELESA